ncbi:MAG: DUF1508 domain-containing protein [Bacilli bacterium]|nr:DUF1508 domain-containing protein [Bacilli bacterium]MBN2876995.1 DUF1508 domain-containing protein [Bacilli bacterium]
MWLFGKKKKKQKDAKLQQEKLAEQAKIQNSETKVPSSQPMVKPVETQKPKEEPKVEVKKTPVPETVQKSEKTTPDEKKSPSGKYEIYPEAGLFKYRLKASNGEVLVVSFGYSSRKGAKSGIETFKKAVDGGKFEISTDKSDFSHFDLFDARNARVIASGEFYSTIKKTESAVDSVKNFYQANKIIDLQEIPASEVREEVVPRQKIEAKENGKFEIIKEGTKDFFVRLLASNGQVLLVSQRYSSKQTAVNGLETIQNAIDQQSFTIYKDKQNRYQYNLYSANSQLIVSGETYSSKSNCLSAIQSVLRFAKKAKTL